jgi:hypothetical protein
MSVDHATRFLLAETMPRTTGSRSGKSKTRTRVETIESLEHQIMASELKRSLEKNKLVLLQQQLVKLQIDKLKHEA